MQSSHRLLRPSYSLSLLLCSSNDCDRVVRLLPFAPVFGARDDADDGGNGARCDDGGGDDVDDDRRRRRSWPRREDNDEEPE